VSNFEAKDERALEDLPGGAAILSHPPQFALQYGGYLVAVRRKGDFVFLPAVAGVPGRQGLDRYKESRLGLAECMVMARPLSSDDVTFLHEPALQRWMIEGSSVDIVLLARLTDFFLGMNAGTWLRVRILDIAGAARKYADSLPKAKVVNITWQT